jgi:hypothetical protein
MNALYDQAIKLVRAGISVIPVAQDKRPTIKWEEFQTRIATEQEIEGWLSNSRVTGIAVVGGKVSGGLLVIDYDVERFYEKHRESGAADVMDTLVWQFTGRTDGIGRQAFLRCDNPGGNQKIAFAPDDAAVSGRKIALETRGEGGYAVVYPSLHPSGQHYRPMSGELTNIHTLTQDQADYLLDTARDTDEAPSDAHVQKEIARHEARRMPIATTQGQVIARFNAEHSIHELLKRNGYTPSGGKYCRPGSQHRTQSVNIHQDAVSYHWSSSDPLSDWNGPCHDAFDVFTYWEYNGDKKAAYKAAAQEQGVWQEWKGDGYQRPAGAVTDMKEYTTTNEVVERKKLLHLSELGFLPKPEWLIENMIRMSTLSATFGPPGQGKSFLHLDLAMTVGQELTVIYVAAEDAEDYHARAAAWLKHHNRKTANIHFWIEPVDLMTEHGADEFLNAILPLNPVLIIIDPLVACMPGGDDGKTEDMSRACASLVRIKNTTGAAVHVVHHTGWDTSRERGSIVLRGTVRLMTSIMGNDDGMVTLKCEKTNHSKKFEPRHFKLIEVDDTVVPMPTSKLATQTAKIKGKALEILQLLDQTIFRAEGINHDEIVKHGFGKSTVTDSLSKLVMQVMVEKDGTRYKITEKGRNYLDDVELSEREDVVAMTGSDGLNWSVLKPQKVAEPQVEASYEEPVEPVGGELIEVGQLISADVVVNEDPDIELAKLARGYANGGNEDLAYKFHGMIKNPTIRLEVLDAIRDCNYKLAAHAA